MTDMGTCACPGCEHDVPSEQASITEGRAYCCTACAAGHPDGMECIHPDCECIHPDCECTELNRPASGDLPKEQF